MTGEPFRSRTFTPIAPADRPRKTRRGVRVVVTDGSSEFFRVLRSGGKIN